MGLDQEKVDAFHAHLDTCEQCRNQPFGLCETGGRLLAATSTLFPDASVFSTQEDVKKYADAFVAPRFSSEAEEAAKKYPPLTEVLGTEDPLTSPEGLHESLTAFAAYLTRKARKPRED